MSANCLDQYNGPIAATWSEVADLGLDLAGSIDTMDGLHRQHSAQPGPGAQRFQVGGSRADEHAPADQAAMVVVEGVEHRRGHGAASKAVPLATLLYRRERLAVIGLDDQRVIGTPIEDLASDCRLAAHGIQRHDAVLQGRYLEQRRDRGDLVRLAVNLTLAEHQALPTGPSVDQMQRSLCPTAVEGAVQRLAVNGHDPPARRSRQRTAPEP